MHFLRAQIFYYAICLLLRAAAATYGYRAWPKHFVVAACAAAAPRAYRRVYQVATLIMPANSLFG